MTSNPLPFDVSEVLMRRCSSHVQWPRYEPVSDRFLELGDSVRVGSRLRQKQYDLLDDAQAALDALFKP